MPVYATFHNTIFDIRCSKCKRTKENQDFVQNGRVHKTCNFCRDQAFRRRMDPEFLASIMTRSAMRVSRHIPDTDTESEPSNNPVDALIALGFDYTDIDNALRMSSSSAAAASTSAADYFVDEPEAEPEPNKS